AMLQHDPDQRPATAAEVQRRIASAAPGAANREASEVGAFATQVRDEREARRAERPRTRDSSRPGSCMIFWPPPRSSRPGSRPGSAASYRLEVESPPPSVVVAAGTVVPASSPWWARRVVQVGLLGLLGISASVGLFCARHDEHESGAV